MEIKDIIKQHLRIKVERNESQVKVFLLWIDENKNIHSLPSSDAYITEEIDYDYFYLD